MNVPGNTNSKAQKKIHLRNVFRTRTYTSDILEIFLTTVTMTKRFAMLLLAALSAVVMAAPGIVEQGHAVAHRSTPTTCVTGTPANESGYAMNYTTVEDLPAGNRFYDIEPGFKSAHSVGSAMVSHSVELFHENLPLSFPSHSLIIFLMSYVLQEPVLTLSRHALEPVCGARR